MAKKKLVEKVRQMFADDFERHWMMTGTRVTYKRRRSSEPKTHMRFLFVSFKRGHSIPTKRKKDQY